MTFAYPCDKSFRRMLTSSNMKLTGCYLCVNGRRRNYHGKMNLHCFVIDSAAPVASATPPDPLPNATLEESTGDKGF